MATPRVLWIRHLPDSPTSNIGSFTGIHERFQFLGSVVSSPPDETAPVSTPATTPRWRAVLHRFQLSGAYVGTDTWVSPAGTSEEEGLCQARERLATWLGTLRGVRYQDIHIRVFSITIGGLLFGLVKATRGLSLKLLPENLCFSAPWSGDPDRSQNGGCA
jgi:hypothetical protein